MPAPETQTDPGPPQPSGAVKARRPKNRAPASDLSPAQVELIARRYDGRTLQRYIRWKLSRDPVYRGAFLALRDSPLPVLDIGCGIGLFECYAREAGGKMPIRGIDFDERKIARAQPGIAGYQGVEIRMADAALETEITGNVVLLDVLHYMPRAAQGPLLQTIAKAIPPGGCCAIRTTLRDRSWRFRGSQVVEWFIGANRWMKVGAGYYPSEADLSEPFRQLGFTCEQAPLWGDLLVNCYLFVFRRPSA